MNKNLALAIFTAVAALVALIFYEINQSRAQQAVPVPTPQYTQSPLFPAGATFVSAASGVVANATANASLPAVSGRTNYVSEIQITNSGATAGACVTAVLSGVISTSFSYVICAPTGVATAAQPLSVNFSPPLPASGSNTAIQISLPPLGAGNTAAAVNIAGFLQ